MSMTLIQEQVLVASAASVVFGSIPQTYTDLMIEGFPVTTTPSNSSAQFMLNGDSAANYSYAFLVGNGSAASSSKAANIVRGILGDDSPTTDAPFTTHILSYSSSVFQKMSLSRGSSLGSLVGIWISRWNNTAPITSITIVEGNGSYQLAAGTRIRLWGIK